MQLFYISSDRQTGDILTLSEEESWHCAKVLRLKPGDPIFVTDGLGSLYRSRLIEIESKSCKLIIEQIDRRDEITPKLHLAIAPTKSTDRFEWFLEKSTEIGIGSITPILCDRAERSVIKKNRLEKILVSAMKQSLRLWLPVLNDVCKFDDLLIRDDLGQRFIAHCGKDQTEPLYRSYIPKTAVTILIGPEGDFSDQEIARALQTGFMPISLGPSRLRTETAGIVAVNTINILNQINRINE